MTSTLTEGITRPQTPPPHTTLQSRTNNPHHTGYSTFRVKEVRTNSNRIYWDYCGKRLVTCGYEKGVRVWTNPSAIEDRHASTLLTADVKTPITCAATHPHQQDLVAGACRADKKLFFWDYRGKSSTRSVSVDGLIEQILYSSDGQQILAREQRVDDSADDTLAVYDIQTGETLHRITGTALGLGRRLLDISFNHNSQLVYVTGGNGAMAIVDYPSLALLDKFNGHTSYCNNVAVDPRGRFVATGGSDALMNIWDAQDWICLRAIPNADSVIFASSFSFDGEYVACSSTFTNADGTIHYVDITESETGQHNVRLPTKGLTTSLAFHPTQAMLAIAGSASTMTGNSYEASRKGPDGWIGIIEP